MFRCAFLGASSTCTNEGFVELVNTVLRKGGSGTITRFANGEFVFPAVRANDAINVVGASNVNIFLVLIDVNAVKIFEGTEILNWRGIFKRELELLTNQFKNLLRCFFSSATDSHVVNLSE